MNAILQKRIEEAAREIGKKFYFVGMNPNEAAYKAAIQMGNKILQNQWISVEEALPPIREKDIENRSWSDWVLIMTHKGGTFKDCYAFHRKEWLNNGNDVTHWMLIPQLKGGEE